MKVFLQKVVEGNGSRKMNVWSVLQKICTKLNKNYLKYRDVYHKIKSKLQNYSVESNDFSKAIEFSKKYF